MILCCGLMKMYTLRGSILMKFCGFHVWRRLKFFFKTAILPELQGKWYSRPSENAVITLSGPSTSAEEGPSTSNATEVYCYCRGPERDDMVACDNPSCPYMWFHFDCLKLTAPPRSKLWFCPECRKLPQFACKRKTIN